MTLKKVVNSSCLVGSPDSNDIKNQSKNPFYEVNAVKRRDVSIEYIAVLPNDVEEDFQSHADLIGWLTSDCADVIEALEEEFNEVYEGRFDEDDLYLFKREHAIEFAENIGYRIHDVLKWRK